MMFLSTNLLAAGQTRYISDNVYLYLHGGPGTQYRILGSIEAGKAVTYLNETQGDFSKIVDHKNREGWVLTKLLSAKKSIRYLVPELQNKIKRLETQLAENQDNSANTSRELSSRKSQLSKLKRDYEQAIVERDKAKADLAKVIDNQQFTLWREGGIIALIGAIIGIILVYLPRPGGRRKDRW